jgi:hypothetical protein
MTGTNDSGQDLSSQSTHYIYKLTLPTISYGVDPSAIQFGHPEALCKWYDIGKIWGYEVDQTFPFGHTIKNVFGNPSSNLARDHRLLRAESRDLGYSLKSHLRSINLKANLAAASLKGDELRLEKLLRQIEFAVEQAVAKLEDEEAIEKRLDEIQVEEQGCPDSPPSWLHSPGPCLIMLDNIEAAPIPDLHTAPRPQGHMEETPLIGETSILASPVYQTPAAERRSIEPELKTRPAADIDSAESLDNFWRAVTLKSGKKP